MADKLAPSELILSNEGRIYHLDLLPEDISDTIISVGDPERVARVSQQFDRVIFKRSHREFVTHTGYFQGKKLTVISTGIGTDNIDIVFNELDALVNIDLNSRTINTEKKVLNIIRIGTSGCLDGNIPVDSFLASTAGIGLDGLGSFYAYQENRADLSNFEAVYRSSERQLPPPYLAKASQSLLDQLPEDFYRGVTLTCTGFYAPQGRSLRLKSVLSEEIDSYGKIAIGSSHIRNFEMETSAMYMMADLLGHRCISLNALIANRITGNFSEDGKSTVKILIERALPWIASLNRI